MHKKASGKNPYDKKKKLHCACARFIKLNRFKGYKNVYFYVKTANEQKKNIIQILTVALG